MSKASDKPVILIAAFGTSAPEGQKDLESVDRLVAKRYPDYEVRWAFTSGFIRKKQDWTHFQNLICLTIDRLIPA